MRIAVEGCCHGELDKIYETVKELERQNGFKIDLLIICGDFQAVRNFDDLQAMAVPPKYQQLNTFYKYYNREKVAPVLTVFIGGNHEASNYMQELSYGGWVAPYIYYMGYAGIIQIGGLRIGGISGIFKGHDFNRGHFERPPYENDTKRSVYHVRNLEVFRLKQITRPVDIFISHDWPKGIYHYGNAATLIKRKPFFQKEIEENKLGSGPLSDLLFHLKPKYWFAAHLHVKFAAHVQHQSQSESGSAKSTKFLALDKCLPRRNFLQVLEIPHNEKEGVKIKLDPEWLTIVRNTDHLLNLTSSNIYMPGPGCGLRFDFQATEKEIEETLKMFGGDMTLPENFVQTSSPIMGKPDVVSRHGKQPLTIQVNPQTTLLCDMLAITDPNAKFIGRLSKRFLDVDLNADVVVEENSGEDVADDSNDEDEGELPSSIDSSMDVSVDVSNISSKWDSYETANETLDSSNQRSLKLPLVTSTPAKNSSFKNTSFNVQVDDNDAEFLSILCAQKSKSLDTSSQLHSTSSLNETDLNSSALPHHGDVVEGSSHSDDLKVVHSNQIQCSTFINKMVNEGGDNIHAASKCHLPTSFSSNEGSTVSSLEQPITLKAERTSFGMSGLCLDSTDSLEQLSSSFSRNVGSSELSESTEDCVSKAAGDGGSAVKKLKRRNVSLYSEPTESVE